MHDPGLPTEWLIGVEGLALLRGLREPDGDPSARLAEIRALLDGRMGDGPPTREATPQEGYAAWAEHYDRPGNPIVELEQPVVWSMLADMSPGDALDAACGTGRHTRRLAELGWTVTGVDLTAQMLERARAAVPGATFTEGDLRALPAETSSVDLVVCGLALAHLADPAVTEFARVLRPGGEAVISTLHPLQIALGWHAAFTAADGTRGFVREHPHTHATYLRAFRQSGLDVLDCAEPALDGLLLQARRRMFAAIPEACTEAFAGLPAVLVWRLRRR